MGEEERQAPDSRKEQTSAGSLIAALAFGYTLVVTVALLLFEGFFSDYDNQSTVLAWLTVPISATFLGWLAMNSPNHYLRFTVWFLVLGVLFFCWIAIFSIGVYYLPAPLLMVIAVLGPWDEREGSDE